MVSTSRRRGSAAEGAKKRKPLGHQRHCAILHQISYDRRVELARVLPLWPHELEDTPEARQRIVGTLRRALRAERQRGVAGHWAYDLHRHVDLLRLYRLELAACDMRDTALPPPQPIEIPRD